MPRNPKRQAEPVEAGLDRGKTVRQRDENGRFLKGCVAGPGRPTLATEREYAEATIANCSPDEWATIVRKTVQDAMQGDAKARDFLAKYVLPSQPDALRVTLEAANRSDLPARTVLPHPLYEPDHRTLAESFAVLMELGLLPTTPVPQPQNVIEGTSTPAPSVSGADTMLDASDIAGPPTVYHANGFHRKS